MHEDASARNRPPEPEAANAGHEVADITLGGLKIFGVILFGTIIVTMFLMAGLMYGLIKYEESQQQPNSPIVSAVPVPPSPMLQPSRYHNTLDSQDMKTFHAEEDAILASYAWVGTEKKSARIPIARAMDIMLAKGYPVRDGKPAGKDLMPVPTGGAGGIINNAANPLDHAPPIAQPLPTDSQ